MYTLKLKPAVLGDGILAESEYFKVRLIGTENTPALTVDDISFTALICLDGEVSFDGVTLKKGESAFVPAGRGEIEFNGRATLIESRV